MKLLSAVKQGWLDNVAEPVRISLFAKVKPSHFLFFLTIAYLTYLNLFIITATTEVTIFEFMLVVGIFSINRLKTFIKEWGYLLSLVLIYEALRGYADDLAPFKKAVVFFVYNLETKIFGTLPTVYLQKMLGNYQLIISICLFFYISFFYYTFIVGFMLWYKKNKTFNYYMYHFLFMLFIGLIIFFLLPTAPPWYVSEVKNLGIIRYTGLTTVLTNRTWVSLTLYFFQKNELAAFPSFHTAWPMYTSTFLYYLNPRYWPFFVIPLGIGFSLVFLGEHYVIDVLAGALMGYSFAYFAFKNMHKNKLEHN